MTGESLGFYIWAWIGILSYVIGGPVIATLFCVYQWVMLSRSAKKLAATIDRIESRYGTDVWDRIDQAIAKAKGES